MALAYRWYSKAFSVHVFEYLFSPFHIKKPLLTYTEHKSFSIQFVPCIPWNLNEMLASNPFSFLNVHLSPVLNDLLMQWSWLSVLLRWWMC